jgi:sugar lactone lactonase YvrE
VEFPDLGACALLVSADACEEGARDDRPAPRGLALDGAGNLFVADEGQAVVWLVDVRGRPALWRAFPDTDPPVAAAVERSGSVLVLVARSVDPSRAGNGVLHRFATRGGQGSVVAVTEPLSEPSGVAVGPGGEIVLALAGGNALALLSADGRERDRLEAADVEGRTGVPLDGPSGVVVSAGSAWVTNGSPRSNTEANWVVFEVPLGA